MRRALAFGLCLGLWATAASSEAQTETPAPPSGAAVSPAEAIARARAALSRETGVLDRIDALDRLLLQLSLSHFALTERLRTQEARLAEIRTGRQELSERISGRRVLVQQRLRARARLDEAAYLRIMLGARDPTEMVHRRFYLRRVLENDARLLRDLRQAETAVAALEKEQREIVAAIEVDKTALDRQMRTLEAERRNRSATLAALRQERDALRRLVSQRDTAAAALVFEGVAEPGAQGFAAEKGRLSLPTAGPIVSRFGRYEDPELGTAVFHKGIEIDALEGAPVRAVHSGRVAFAGWYKGFGNLLILAHGDAYYTLYAHLASISRAAGDTVSGGDVLGEVGDTGSLRGPLLYFEIRAHKTSLDPEAWLEKRR